MSSIFNTALSYQSHSDEFTDSSPQHKRISLSKRISAEGPYSTNIKFASSIPINAVCSSSVTGVIPNKHIFKYTNNYVCFRVHNKI